MSIEKGEIKALSRALGMSMCGIADVGRFQMSPEGKHPDDVLPGCKSVIVVGVKLLDGVIQANFRAFAEAHMPADTQGLQHINSWNCGRCQTYCPAGNWAKHFKQTGLSKGPVFISSVSRGD